MNFRQQVSFQHFSDSWFHIMCSSRKNPYPHNGRSLKIQGGGREVLKAKILEAKYKLKLNWNFLLGRGCKAKKNFCGGGGYGYFLELLNIENNLSSKKTTKY